MLVQDVMDKSFPQLYKDELATKARSLLRSQGLRVVPVVDDNKRLVGMVSRGDVMTITSSISPIQVRGIMSHPRFIATIGMDVSYVGQEMVRLHEWYIPVTKSSQDYTYMGVLGLENFIAAFLKRGTEKFSRSLSEIMSTDLVTCSPGDEIDNVWRWMKEQSFAGLPVVEEKKVVGMITQKNLLDSGAIFPVFEAKKGRFNAPSRVSSVMKTPVFSLHSTASIREAAELMLERNIGRVPITDEKNRLVGIVDREDVVKSIL